ncbi:MAG TPA: hypothetical protein VIB79_01430 [Candidatus Binatia bacterium]|jgi:hypothetical protein
MAENYIPDEIARFVLDKIDSIAELEALLLLRNEPREKWTIDLLAKRLYITPKQTSEVVARLCASGLATVNGIHPPEYRYVPSSRELAQSVDRLAKLYAKHLVPITNLIHSKPKTRVQEFADAFIFRKDK